MPVMISLHFLVLLTLSVFLTGATGVLGAIPMRQLYQKHGVLPFWIAQILAITLLVLLKEYAFAMLQTLVVFLVGGFSFIEDHKIMKTFGTLLTTVAATSCSLIIGLVTWKGFTGGPKWIGIKKYFELQWTEISKVMGSGVELKIDQLLNLLPSLVIGSMILTLGVMLLVENFSRPLARKSHHSLVNYRVPGALVWMLMLSLLGAYSKHGMKDVALFSENVLYFISFLFFIQGLAVIVTILKNSRLHIALQILIVTVLFLQHIFLSAVGVFDYWFDFRQRSRKRKTQDYQKFLGE